MNVRPFVDDDAPAVAALMSAEEESLYRPRPARGTTRVTLDVDAQNAIGAVALYEHVGMHVETCGVALEKPTA